MLCPPTAGVCLCLFSPSPWCVDRRFRPLRLGECLPLESPGLPCFILLHWPSSQTTLLLLCRPLFWLILLKFALFSPTRPHWAELVIESPCPSVCMCLSVCPPPLPGSVIIGHFLLNTPLPPSEKSHFFGNPPPFGVWRHLCIAPFQFRVFLQKNGQNYHPRTKIKKFQN